MPFVKIDSHAHLTCDELYTDLGEVIKRAKEQNIVALININTDPITLRRGIEVAQEYPGYFFNTGATTPHDVEKEGEKNFPVFRDAATKGNLIAIGETGLDYYYEHAKRKVQQEFFIKYLDLARETNLPLIIHCRGEEAFSDLFQLSEPYLDVSCLLHCFTGGKEEVNEAIKRGWYISISGIATFKKSEELRNVIETIPLDRILIETDSPYLAPQSKRGQVNEPANISEVLTIIARCKNRGEEEVSTQIVKNTCEFFHISSSILEKH